MNDPELDADAQALYEACDTVKPRWDQLSETTKDVWRGYVLAGTQVLRRGLVR